MAGGGTPTDARNAGFPVDARGIRLAVRILPVALILLSAAVSHRVMHSGGVASGTGNRSSLLEAVSRRAEFGFGFRNLLADIAWLEAVQVSGVRKMARDDYDRLADLLATVARFDPRFVVPYLLGGIVLAESPHHTTAALRLLEQGERQVPAEWRIPFYTGYIRYFSLGEPVEGGMALLRASRIAGSPPHFPLLAARMLSEGHQPETALAFLQNMIERETDSRRKASLEERVRQVEVERDLQYLEKAIGEYTTRVGAPPRQLADLVQAGLLARIPEEPYGGEYQLMPDGQVRSDRAPGGRLKVLRIR